MSDLMSIEELRRLLAETEGKAKRGRPGVRGTISGTKSWRDGHKFDSKLEAAHYDKLALLEQAGEVRMFLSQVPLRLPGGVKYTVDFLVFWSDGRITFEETKGFRREAYVLRKRIAQAYYGIEIQEIRKEKR